MVKVTNLKKLKEAMKLMFDAFEFNMDRYGIVSHPYANSIAVMLKGDKDIHLLTDVDTQKKYRKQIFDEIDNMTLNTIESTWYMLINKPYLLTMLKYCKDFMKESLFADLLADAWVRSENPNGDVNVSIEELIDWFRDVDKKKIMIEEDYEYWKNLPNTITLYRGVSKGRNPMGLSWTYDIDTAEWFANRFHRFDYVLKAEVPKDLCLVYFNTRDEKEIIVDTLTLKELGLIERAEG